MIATQTKQCRTCLKYLPLDAFYRNPTAKSGYQASCKECKKQNVKKWCEANPDRVKRAKKKHHGKSWRRRKNNQMRTLYGIDVETYEKLFAEQNGLCAVCKKPETLKRGDVVVNLSLDHCHTTGKIRGLLCANCNNGMGRFKDDPALLRAAAEYLEARRVDSI
jgi:hypothetical protein